MQESIKNGLSADSLDLRGDNFQQARACKKKSESIWRQPQPLNNEEKYIGMGVNTLVGLAIRIGEFLILISRINKLFSVEGQIATILGFVGHLVSIVTTQLYHFSSNVATDYVKKLSMAVFQ